MKKIKFTDSLREELNIPLYLDKEYNLHHIKEDTPFTRHNNLISNYIDVDNIYFRFLLCQYIDNVQDVVISSPGDVFFIQNGLLNIRDRYNEYSLPFDFNEINVINNCVCFGIKSELSPFDSKISDKEFLVMYDSNTDAQIFYSQIESATYDSGSSIWKTDDYFDKVSLLLMELQTMMINNPIVYEGKEVYNVITGKKQIQLENKEILGVYRESKEFGWKLFTTYCEDNLNLIKEYFPSYKSYNREESIKELIEK